jgi:hypothetical protein
MKKILLSTAVLAVVACSNVSGTKTGQNEVMYINGVLANCVGVGPMKCMQVKKDLKQTEWENFYGNIEGFNYQEGFTYTLKINKIKLENPPADGSSVKYKLLEIVDKKPMVYMK